MRGTSPFSLTARRTTAPCDEAASSGLRATPIAKAGTQTAAPGGCLACGEEQVVNRHSRALVSYDRSVDLS
jgi:hypothetical protein